MEFVNPSRGRMSFEEIVEEIVKFVKDEPDQVYHLIVGSDSQTSRQWTCYVTAIIIHRQGKGGRFFYTRKNEKRQTSLRQRIFSETALSLAMADQLREALRSLGVFDLPVEIHMDVGSRGETRDLVREVTGMVMGSGFDAYIKPYSSGASKVADRYTK